ncbi:DUF262 domain-containing protein [Janthinobacterium sp. RB2R34]|uniref:DUF262 domain-containing protein n=1 Tax=Janthinobacterium sp. RB2R34 TaxID=3424193 RepID=UPI003F2919C2
MQANPRTLDTLFSSQLRYIVPMFQRLYVWQQKPQWETLWEDISEKANLQIAGVSTTPHYLGALIIDGVKAESPREVKRFLIIDGQQRLTTLQLLLCAFRDVAQSKGWLALAKPINRFLENPDPESMEKPEEEVFKLWPTLLNRDVFKGVLSAKTRAEVERRYPLIKLPKKRKPKLRSNLVEAYLYFDASIRAHLAGAAAKTGRAEEDLAFSLFQSLKQDFCVVEIVLSEGDDSQEIFYSLNSQGRPLSQSDLLRSLIFMRAEKQKLDRDAIFDKYWSQFETPFWSSETTRGGRTYSRLDLGLRYFLMTKTGAMIDARRVNEEYRHWISSTPPKYGSVEHELADFVRHSQVYERYESASAVSLPSTDLRRVLIDFDVSTALPLVMYLEVDAGLDETQLTESLALVESFVARRVITGGENKEYNIFFVEVIRSLMGLKPASVLAALAAKLMGSRGSTRSWPTDAEVADSVRRRAVGSELKAPALRVILERLELRDRSKKSESLEVQQLLQIEHVMPVSWSEHWPLQGVAVPKEISKIHWLAKDEFLHLQEPIRQRNAALQTLGNLTLLNKYLNPAASNGGFALKLNEYQHSVLRLNRYFHGFADWSEEAIERRGALLAEAVCEIWKRPSGAGSA